MPPPALGGVSGSSSEGAVVSVPTLSGSEGSVCCSGGSVTGGSSVPGALGSVAGALGSVAGTVGSVAGGSASGKVSSGASVQPLSGVPQLPEDVSSVGSCVGVVVSRGSCRSDPVSEVLTPVSSSTADPSVAFSGCVVLTGVPSSLFGASKWGAHPHNPSASTTAAMISKICLLIITTHRRAGQYRGRRPQGRRWW